MKIFNSLTLKKEEVHFKKDIKIYVCGPTTYADIHIGNARPIVFFDTVARSLKFLGYNPILASNFTDIDDRIILRAKESGVSEKLYTDQIISRILEFESEVNCLKAAFRPRVTEYIKEIIMFISSLIEKKYAYIKDGDVLFRVKSAKEYGICSHQDINSLLKGVRIELSGNKENPLDFVLWKQTKDGIKWPSPWGEGRPGWHTECVVMINKIFNGKIDIHGGGLDLKFPHHENEIAQANALFNHKIASLWMHNGLVTFDDQKMSKSLGNDLKAKVLLDEIGFEVFRILILSSPYRQPLIFNETTLNQAKNLKNKLIKPFFLYYNLMVLEGVEMIDTNYILNEYKEKFVEALEDDFNFANCFTVLSEMIKQINTNLIKKDFSKISQELFFSYKSFISVLGLFKSFKSISDEDKQIYKAWNAARIEKDFSSADKFRKILIEKELI